MKPGGHKAARTTVDAAVAAGEEPTKACAARRALAGAVASWPIWPGAVRHVQSESLKTADLSLGRFLTPGCRSR